MNHTTTTVASKSVVAIVLLLVSCSSQALSCPPPTFDGYDFGGETIRFQVSASDADAIVVKGADKATFEVIDYPKGLGTAGCAPPKKEYARDASKMYFRGRLIAGADPGSWAFINSNYGQDKHGYYANGRRVQGEGFVMLVYNYAKTDREVFLNGIQLKGADAATFEVWLPSVRTARDKAQVYFDEAPIPQVDVATFEQVKTYLFRDKRAVYLMGKELAGMKPTNLRFVGGYILDDRVVYRLAYSKRVWRDSSTFDDLGSGWSKDKDGIYYADERVMLADVPSFVSDKFGARDKNYRFSGGRATCKFNSQAEGTMPACQ